MKDFLIFDAHCDTITRLMENNQSLFKNDCHVDLVRMKEYKGFVQMFAAWISPDYSPYAALKRCLQIIDAFYYHLEQNKEHISLVRNAEELKRVLASNRIAAFLSVEGGEALQGDLGVLRMLYRLGVRSICLTWNGRNEIGDGVGEECTNGGLTTFGRKVIGEMNRLGMLIDVSHLSERGFWDVVSLSSQPIIASHSNARKVCDHPRNLSDDQFNAIVKGGGVVGINLYPDFLSAKGYADINDVIKHIEHFMSLGGENHIGLGLDFDGIDKTPRGFYGVKEITILLDSLLKLNYSQEQVEKIASVNFLNNVDKVLKN